MVQYLHKDSYFLTQNLPGQMLYYEKWYRVQCVMTVGHKEVKSVKLVKSVKYFVIDVRFVTFFRI